jgi:hypothetical protein
MSRIFACALLVAAVAALAFAALKSRDARTASGPLTSACYVWQRSWDDAVKDAVASAPAAVGGFAPLCAEITWGGNGNAVTAWPTLDANALKKSGRPTSAVLRVSARSPTPEGDAQICRIAAEVLRRLRASGIDPTELQVDFDCAKTQLRGYRKSLEALRRTVGPLPVIPTALPSWLTSSEFAALAKESGAYILQVHATRRPSVDAPETALCEVDDARKWVEQAGRLGAPFRVALPTYAYRVAFAPNGRFLGIEAEGAPHVWPAEAILRIFRPDPVQVAALVHDWKIERPANLTGLLWYRLPVSTDTQNWRWPTLAAVLQGRAPRAELRVEKTGNSPTDLVLVNSGEADAPLPRRVVVTSAKAIQAADGIGGYRADISGSDVIFERAEELASTRIPPGSRRPMGWLRSGGDLFIQTP